jgi:flavin reductase (DIM6/NTAB) family NADH-FMN oxidoreductase RutF
MGPYRSLDPFLGGMNTPMFVVTTVHPDSGERAGCLVGFASQCSIEPDRFAVWLSQRNHTYRVAMEAKALAVHGLAEGDRELAELFGTQTGDEVD